MTFYHLSNRYLSNIMKILAKINTMQNRTYQHFTFCSFTVLNKLKALQLSKACLSTIISSINTVKIWHHGQKPLEPKHMKKMQIVCKSLFTKSVYCPPLARTHVWRRFLHWSIAVSIMSCQKSGHTAIQRSFSSSTVVTAPVDALLHHSSHTSHHM